MKFAFVLPFTIYGLTLHHQRTINELDDLLITVKSTRKNHETRLNLLLETWHTDALDRTYIVTDQVEKKYTANMIATNCQHDHSR